MVIFSSFKNWNLIINRTELSTEELFFKTH